MRIARRKSLLTAVVSMVLVVGALAAATSASADSIQVQSDQRASQSAACTAQPGETPWLDSWGDDPSWHPTWEQWANNGKGGWTCTRSITWAHADPEASCTHVLPDTNVILDPSGFIPANSLVFLDAACTIDNGEAGNPPYGFAFAPGGLLAAESICRTGNSEMNLYSQLYQGDLYFCAAPPP